MFHRFCFIKKKYLFKIMKKYVAKVQNPQRTKTVLKKESKKERKKERKKEIWGKINISQNISFYTR